MEDMKCSVCGNMYSKSERDEDYPKIPPSFLFCGYCLENDEAFARCKSCDAYFEVSQGIDVENRLICLECKETNTIICSICGQMAIKDRRNRKIEDLCDDCEIKQLYRKHIDELKLGDTVSYSVSFGQIKISKTVHLMSRLRHSYGDNPTDVNDSPFDSLLISMWQWYRRMVLNYGFALVVIYGLPSRLHYLAKGSCTMTEFTKSHISEWDKINNERCKERIELTNGEVFYLWDNPYNLRAVTASDTDFRKEYVYGELRYEGNNYGDTSDFFIIGSVANKNKD